MYIEVIVHTLLRLLGIYLLLAVADCAVLHIVYPKQRLYGVTLCAEWVGAPLLWLCIYLLPAPWLWVVIPARVLWCVPLFGLYRLAGRGAVRVHAGAAAAVSGVSAAVCAMLCGVLYLL